MSIAVDPTRGPWRCISPANRRYLGPLLTLKVLEQLLAARSAGLTKAECSLDLQRSVTSVAIAADAWSWNGETFSYPKGLKDRTVYHWTESGFEAAARYSGSLIKLVPTEWGPPTFEIDGIKMLPTARVSPYADAQRKVALIQPRGKVILDTCGGLGYFAAWCLHGKASRVLSYEKNSDVIWLRGLNPWSPSSDDRLTLQHADIAKSVGALPDNSVDAVLHDPPRFGIAGDLYSQVFYDQLTRVLKRRGRLFHYTGSPNKITSGREVTTEVANRLRRCGFAVQRTADGLLSIKE